ncbi:hypothetical protein [Terasakiella sp.]|uniref:Nmad2 family putative nucleotide modification protein n=1 Tax=Terasakiella sp. TaxID=2034861 RepID=UPI003AA8358A
MTQTKDDIRLFSYKLTHDSGFAPNPFFGVLTLATCKPGIRQTKKVGDWIAGFSSVALSNSAKQCGIAIHPKALIYLAQVSEVMPLDEYYCDQRFKEKIPPKQYNENQIQCAGDNIYKLTAVDSDGQRIYEQVSQLHHDQGHYKDDIGGRNVLIFSEYYYLGRSGMEVPDSIELSRPIGPTQFGYKSTNFNQVTEFIAWVKTNFKQGLNDYPCLWNEQRSSKCRGC